MQLMLCCMATLCRSPELPQALPWFVAVVAACQRVCPGRLSGPPELNSHMPRVQLLTQHHLQAPHTQPENSAMMEPLLGGLQAQLPGQPSITELFEASYRQTLGYSPPRSPQHPPRSPTRSHRRVVSDLGAPGSQCSSHSPLGAAGHSQEDLLQVCTCLLQGEILRWVCLAFLPLPASPWATGGGYLIVALHVSQRSSTVWLCMWPPQACRLGCLQTSPASFTHAATWHGARHGLGACYWQVCRYCAGQPLHQSAQLCCGLPSAPTHALLYKECMFCQPSASLRVALQGVYLQQLPYGDLLQPLRGHPEPEGEHLLASLASHEPTSPGPAGKHSCRPRSGHPHAGGHACTQQLQHQRSLWEVLGLTCSFPLFACKSNLLES